jgi:membrane-bound ClpP family serine protease
MNARLVIAIITSLIDEVIIIAIIVWILPRFDVRIPLWGIVLIAIAFVIYAIFSFIIATRILRKKPLAGQCDMIGTEGRVVTQLKPEGFVRIAGELWKSKAEKGPIEAGVDVLVIAQEGFRLVVRRKS